MRVVRAAPDVILTNPPFGGEEEKGCRGRDLELRNGRAAVGLLRGEKRIDQGILGDVAPADPDALVKTHEVRRNVGVYAIACGLETSPHCRHSGALAFSAGNMHDRR